MKICPNCETEANDNAKYCTKCGLCFDEEKNITIQYIVAIVVFIVIAFVSVNILNYRFEQKNLQPYSKEFKHGDSIVKVYTVYDKYDQKISIDITTDLKIEKWQIYQLSANNKYANIKFSGEKYNKEIQSQPFDLKIGQYFSVNFLLYNQKAQDYINIKKCFNDERLIIDTPDFISLWKDTRKKAKSRYIEEVNRERLRQQYYNSLVYPYYNYGYYY